MLLHHKNKMELIKCSDENNISWKHVRPSKLNEDRNHTTHHTEPKLELESNGALYLPCSLKSTQSLVTLKHSLAAKLWQFLGLLRKYFSKYGQLVWFLRLLVSCLKWNSVVILTRTSHLKQFTKLIETKDSHNKC